MRVDLPLNMEVATKADCGMCLAGAVLIARAKVIFRRQECKDTYYFPEEIDLDNGWCRWHFLALDRVRQGKLNEAIYGYYRKEANLEATPSWHFSVEKPEFVEGMLKVVEVIESWELTHLSPMEFPPCGPVS